MLIWISWAWIFHLDQHQGAKETTRLFQMHLEHAWTDITGHQTHRRRPELFFLLLLFAAVEIDWRPPGFYRTHHFYYTLCPVAVGQYFGVSLFSILIQIKYNFFITIFSHIWLLLLPLPLPLEPNVYFHYLFCIPLAHTLPGSVSNPLSF